MEKLSREAIQELMSNNEQPAITIYIPMHTTASPPHITENQIRFKNLLHKASGQLKSHGTEQALAKALETTVTELHDDLEFWENQSPGLLLCAAPGKLCMFQLPIDTEEYIAVDKQFHLAPVLALLEDAKEFYVLTIAQRNPKLLRGDMYGLHATSIHLPATIKAALNIDENNQKSENQGTAAGPSTQGASGAPNSSRGWFNGRGGARNPQEEDRLRFFRILDSIICEKTDRTLPLILAGIDAETAEYRNLSRYPHMLRETIAGNHTETPHSKLFEPTLEIMRLEVIEPEHQAALEEYERLSGANPSRVVRDQKNLLAAAEQGRIDKLLAATYQLTSDTVRDTLSDVLRLTFPEPAVAKALNKAAATVWQMSGKIVSFPPEQLPSNVIMVARLRY